MRRWTALKDSEAADLPHINVAPNQGKLLWMLARIQHARSILEIGTLGGYSTIWLARALPADGKLITLEIDAKHAEVARTNIARAGLASKVELRLGKAIDSLAKIEAERRGPFDLIFIDADKPSNPEYFRRALKLSRPGSLIIVDNVVRDGEVINAASTDASVQGVRRFNEMLAAEKRVSGYRHSNRRQQGLRRVRDRGGCGKAGWCEPFAAVNVFMGMSGQRYSRFRQAQKFGRFVCDVTYLEAKAMAAFGMARATLDDHCKSPKSPRLSRRKDRTFLETGYKPNRVARRIARSLDDYATECQRGFASRTILVCIPSCPLSRVLLGRARSY